MKYLLFAPIALFLCSFDLGEKTPESMPEYDVKLIKADASLPNGTGQVIFSFTSDGNTTIRDSIKLSYNGVTKTVFTGADGKASLGLKAGKYKFQFYQDSDHYEIYTDSINIKAGWQTGITVYFQNSNYPVIAEKPVIYFYPDATQQVSVQLNVTGELGFTYPVYNNGWNFTADPDGTIHMNDKEYDYLFWDGETHVNMQSIERFDGYLVKRDSLPYFFETQLTAMGLNAREQEDFITYWCPRMQKNETSYIHFMFKEEYESVASLNITPKPDNLFRVFMLWDDGNGIDPNAIQPQTIEPLSREGFTVVEWGGGQCDFFDYQ